MSKRRLDLTLGSPLTPDIGQLIFESLVACGINTVDDLASWHAVCRQWNAAWRDLGHFDPLLHRATESLRKAYRQTKHGDCVMEMARLFRTRLIRVACANILINETPNPNEAPEHCIFEGKWALNEPQMTIKKVLGTYGNWPALLTKPDGRKTSAREADLLRGISRYLAHWHGWQLVLDSEEALHIFFSRPKHPALELKTKVFLKLATCDMASLEWEEG